MTNHIALFLLAITTLSCGPAVEHEIFLEDEGMIMMNIESKATVDELKEIAHYYFDDYQHNNFLMVNICVPSEYPGYPETPWAQVIIDGLNYSPDNPAVSVTIYGTATEMEKENLINISPDADGIKGKWYFNEPMLESVYFLVENASDTLMLIFDAEEYREQNGEPYSNWANQEISGRTDQADWVQELCRVPGANVYCILPSTEPSYRINEKGELILEDRQKTWKDTSRCILQPLKF